MPTVRTTTASLLAVVLVVALGGCADDGPDGGGPGALPAPTAPTTVAAPAPSVPDDGAVDADGAGDASGDASDEAPPSVIVPVDTVTVQSLDNIFRPEIIEVEVGTEVVWVNVGRMEHDVTPADPDATWGVTADDFLPGDEYRHVFTEPGVYDYFCSIHGTATVGQIGSVVVREPAS